MSSRNHMKMLKKKKQEKLEDKHAKYQKYCKVHDHCHYMGEYKYSNYNH